MIRAAWSVTTMASGEIVSMAARVLALRRAASSAARTPVTSWTDPNISVGAPSGPNSTSPRSRMIRSPPSASTTR